MDNHAVSHIGRRRPNQARSRDKLELIFEASARILNKHGLDGFTTNRIAEVAGISIGTLYQYFSNKQDILAALGQREIDQLCERITAQTLAYPDEPDRLRALVKNLLQVFDGRHRVRRILLELIWRQQGLQGLNVSLMQLMNLMHSPTMVGFLQQSRNLTDADIFILSSTITGIFRASLLQELNPMSKQDLEDKIVLLIRCYMNQIQVEQPGVHARQSAQSAQSTQSAQDAQHAHPTLTS